MVTYIVACWVLMGFISCYVDRENIGTKGLQLWTMIFAPIVFCMVLFDWFIDFLNSPAIGRKK
jgi:hypothetical protein